jgi:tight adherence protein B
MVELTLAGLLLAGLIGLGLAWQRRVARLAALDLLDASGLASAGEPGQRRQSPPFARRHLVLPWLAAVLVGLGVLFVIGLSWPFAAAFALLVGLLGSQADALWLQLRQNRIEGQLADAIGLMISAVNVGASLQSALENALAESPQPLRGVLEEIVGRIRLGDDPIDVMSGLRRQVPLETFQLFATTLAVNWRTGGSLSQTLANVERTVRDRIETSRRIQAMTLQTRVSVAGVLLATAFIAGLVWRNNPERMTTFLRSSIGQYLTAGAIGLQGIGLVWISWLSRPKF